jgi:hypothetical protein
MASDQHVLPGPQVRSRHTFEQVFSRNPKVIGATKALVETVGESVETPEKIAPGQ